MRTQTLFSFLLVALATSTLVSATEKAATVSSDSNAQSTAPADKYLWLEDVTGERSLD